jgi:addiction module HigA family antidote
MLEKKPTHPGELLLKEFLEPMGITQKDFAEHLGWTYARLSEIIHAKRGLSIESALTLAEVFEMEPEFWLNLQLKWDLWHGKQSYQSLPKKTITIIQQLRKRV